MNLSSLYFLKEELILVLMTFQPFVREIDHLLRDDYTNDDIVYKFFIRHYILDAPTRTKVNCCIEHEGYCACEKCEVVGGSTIT